MKKHIFIALAVVFLLSSPLTAEYLVDDCEDGDGKTAHGGSWYTTDDSDSNGKSPVTPKPGTFKMTK